MESEDFELVMEKVHTGPPLQPVRPEGKQFGWVCPYDKADLSVSESPNTPLLLCTSCGRKWPALAKHDDVAAMLALSEDENDGSLPAPTVYGTGLRLVVSEDAA